MHPLTYRYHCPVCLVSTGAVILLRTRHGSEKNGNGGMEKTGFSTMVIVDLNCMMDTTQSRLKSVEGTPVITQWASGAD